MMHLIPSTAIKTVTYFQRPNNVSNRAWFKTKYLFTMTNKQPDPMIVSSREQMKKESNKGRGNLFPGKIPFPAVSLKNCLSETPEEAPSGIILSKLLENRTGVFSKSICGKVACLGFSKYKKLKTVAPPAAMPMKMEREYKVESQLVSVRKSGWGSNEFTVVFDSCFPVTYSMEHMFTVLKNIVVLVPSPRENCINLENRLIPRDMNSDGKSRVVRYGDTKYHIDCNVIRFFCALRMVHFIMKLENRLINEQETSQHLGLNINMSLSNNSPCFDYFYKQDDSSDDLHLYNSLQDDTLLNPSDSYYLPLGDGYIESENESVADSDSDLLNLFDSDGSPSEEELIHTYYSSFYGNCSNTAEDDVFYDGFSPEFIQSEIELTKSWIALYIQSEIENIKIAIPDTVDEEDHIAAMMYDNSLVDLMTGCEFTGMNSAVKVTD